MSRRHVLEDSDSEESHDNNGGGHSSSTKDAVIARFFTSDEIEAIQRCHIQMYTTNGIYSEECMTRIIERLLNEAPIELIVSAAAGGSPSSSSRPSYQKYRPKSGAEKSFFMRDIYNLHDPKTSSVSSDTSYFEEEILFEIELLRRSEKAVKNRMFKNKDKGVMVVFGPWWNYAFQRLLEVCSSNCSAESLGDYTAVKIIRSLFHFITDDLKEIVKPGSLNKAKANFGLDWLHNIATARKVVDQCGVRAQFLDQELSVVEAHVESLKEKKKPVSLLDTTSASVTSKPAQEVTTAGTAGTPSKPDQDDAQNNARKARLAAMRKGAMRTVAPPPMQTAAAPPPMHTTPTPLPVQETSHGVQSIDRNTTSGGPVVDHDGGWGRKRDGNSAINSSSGGRADARTFSPNGPPQIGTSNRNEFDRNSSATGQGLSTSNVSASNNSGWGRNRDDAQPIKSKCTWSSARQMLNHNVAQPESDAPDRQQNNHCTGGDRYTSTSSGSDYNSSQYRDSNISGRYEDRSYHRGGSRNGDRDDYRYDDSRGRHDDYRDDKYRQSRSQEGNTNYRNEYNAQGLKRGWSSDHNDGESRPQKAARGTFETSAQPVAIGHASAAIPSGIGRGRGAHVNKPAWMVRQEQSSVNDRLVGIQGSGGPSGEISSLGAPPQAESHTHRTGISSNNHSNFPVAQPNQNYANNAPITSGDPAASAYPPSMNTARAVSDDVHGMGRGRGRGRGASRNLPAWMTNQSNP